MAQWVKFYSMYVGFSSGHVWMWELDYEESWAPKNWCFWTVVLEKILESPLDCKEIQPVNSEGDQPWVFIGRTDAKAETPILWPPHAKSWLLGKDFDAGRNWGQQEKGMTEDDMAGWHHWLDGREFEWTPGDGDGQGGLACCDLWGHKELDLTDQLNWLTELMSTQGLESWDVTWPYVQSPSRPSKKTRALFQNENCYHWLRLLFCCKVLRVWAIITVAEPSRGSIKHPLFMIASVRNIVSAGSWDLVFSRFPLQSELSVQPYFFSWLHSKMYSFNELIDVCWSMKPNVVHIASKIWKETRWMLPLFQCQAVRSPSEFGVVIPACLKSLKL